MNTETRTEQTAASRQQSQWLPVTVTGIQDSKPPRLEFYSVMTLRDGQQKPCPGTARIEDDALLRRLRTEMEAGGAFRIYIHTDWGVEDIPVVLLDFCRQ